MKSITRWLAAVMTALTMVLALAACEKETKQADSTRTGNTVSSEALEQRSAQQQADTAVYNGLFDNSIVHTVDVTISAEDWEDLRANPLEKTKYETTVTIDGETVEQVSFATKGNTSLSAVASNQNSDRYSFKLNFGKFNKGQTYHGLNKLSLNNLYADASLMKDWLSYQLFRQLDVDAPLTSYVWLRINGADQGLYLAIEDVSEAWLERTQNGKGVVYKPETEEMEHAGGANNPGFPGGDDKGNNPGTPPSGFPGGDGQGNNPGTPPGGMGFGQNSNGADLQYKDDTPESYSDIFDNDETAKDEGAEARVIAALKALSEGKPTEALDTEEVIRYFAAHNFVLNYDSYTGNMLHNYYLYENNGRLSMIPWDYNLAFGGFMGGGKDSTGQGNDATALINTGIDTPLSGTTESSRPMWAWISADENYLSQYHSAFDTLLSSYFENGTFQTELDRMIALLRPYVEKDPTAFYTVEEFDSAADTLRQFCLLRASSIRKQLSGTLSTHTDTQEASDRVSASDVNVAALGGMGGGKKKDGLPERQP